MLFKLSVPLDERLTGLVHDITMRIGEERGLPLRDAESIARTVDEAMAEALSGQSADGRVDLRFHCDEGKIEIGVFFPAPPGLRDRTAAKAAGGLVGEAGEHAGHPGTVHHRFTRKTTKPCRRKQP